MKVAGDALQNKSVLSKRKLLLRPILVRVAAAAIATAAAVDEIKVSPMAAAGKRTRHPPR